MKKFSEYLNENANVVNELVSIAASQLPAGSDHYQFDKFWITVVDQNFPQFSSYKEQVRTALEKMGKLPKRENEPYSQRHGLLKPQAAKGSMMGAGVTEDELTNAALRLMSGGSFGKTSGSLSELTPYVGLQTMGILQRELQTGKFPSFDSMADAMLHGPRGKVSFYREKIGGKPTGRWAWAFRR